MVESIIYSSYRHPNLFRLLNIRFKFFFCLYYVIAKQNILVIITSFFASRNKMCIWKNENEWTNCLRITGCMDFLRKHSRKYIVWITLRERTL